MRALGLLKPPDTKHIEKYPLSALPPEARPTHAPVPIGVNWYTGFDSPALGSDGKYRLPTTNLGTVRGGHCVCLEPAPQPGQPGNEQETHAWWRFYNQGPEGACVGFGHSRALSLLYRRTFDAFWLYDDARRLEGTYPEGEGTTCRSACEALRRWGAHFQSGRIATHSRWYGSAPGIEIGAYRWATTADEVLAALGYASGSEIPLLNSWGEDYPEVVYLSPETLERLLQEGGEADVITER